MTSNVTYYVYRPYSTNYEPASVFKFYNDFTKEPERFSAKEKRWIVAPFLYRILHSHDFDHSSRVDEDQANHIIDLLKVRGPL